jgi:glycerophosphoryl diester phosphodiesterase
VIEVRARDGRPWRIGHRGAAALAPGNTLASLERAVAEGVHAVEFDVLDLADGTLVLAHSDDLHDVSHGAVDGRLRQRTLPEARSVVPALATLDEALTVLAAVPATGVHVDLKLAGYEPAVVDALRRHDVVERTLISTCFPRSLAAVGELEPRLRLGLAYPLDSRGLSRRRALTPVLLPALVAMRLALPLRVGRWIERTGATVLALHWFLVSRRAVERCHARGTAVWAWTVDSRRVAARLTAAGVDGLISNDPRRSDARLTA